LGNLEWAARRPDEARRWYKLAAQSDNVGIATEASEGLQRLDNERDDGPATIMA